MAKVPRKNFQRQTKFPHGRKYGKGDSYPLPVWNGVLDHYSRIGPAIWEFLWLVDKITFEDADGIGWCLGRTPIKSKTIAKDLGKSPDAVKENLRRLDKRYIVRIRTPYGEIIGVRKSCKFDIWKKKPTEPIEGAREVASTPPLENREVASTPREVASTPRTKKTQQGHSNEEVSGHSNQTDQTDSKPIRPSVPNQTDGRHVSQEPKSEREYFVQILNALQLNSDSRHWPVDFDISPIELTSALLGWLCDRSVSALKNTGRNVQYPAAYFLQAARAFFEQHDDDWYQILERFLGFAEDNGFVFSSGSWIDTRANAEPIPFRKAKKA